jgi:hypothetical protein
MDADVARRETSSLGERAKPRNPMKRKPGYRTVDATQKNTTTNLSHAPHS